MKLAVFDDWLPGRIEGDAVVDLSEDVGPEIMRLRPTARMNAIIADFDRLGPLLAAADGPRWPLGEVRLRAPAPEPGKMLFALGNYPEGPGSPKGRLNLALKSPSSILDPGGVVVLPPRDAVIFHHEAELAVVIGKRARAVSEADALSHVFGYTAVLDVTARGLGYGLGIDSNSFDSFCPMGPWIVTADEITDPQGLHVRHWQDGQLREDYGAAEMEASVAQLIVWASAVGALEPGDILACGVSHQALGPMQDGEASVVEISGIGRLEVSVSDPLGRRWPKTIDAGLAEAARKAREQGTPLNLKAASMARVG
jgi:2-keto-4-pentenoate hydratase/2-oxohepta-3-ene-1,7-dioic acid hydratase in catechol pathway